jgi:hypothetical protein
MTPQDLRTLILSQPQASPIRVAFAEARDVDCAELLSSLTRRGRVPVADLRLYAIECGLIGSIGLVTKVGDVSTEAAREFFGLCVTVQELLAQDQDINVDNPKFLAGLGAFVAAGLLTSEQRDEIHAMGNNRKPIAAVSHLQVAAARKASD